MKALVDFEGVIDGKFKAFKAGDKISKKDAEAMGLADKPDLANESGPDKPADE